MKNALMYISTVLLWGSTWLAIEYQLGEVDIITSVFFRFLIATVLMWAYCLWMKIPLSFSIKNHGFILLLALGNFSVNYVLIYQSQQYLTSAMTSIAFSTMLIMNIINTRLLFGTQIAAKVYVGAALGLLGLVALFWNDLSVGSSSLTGLTLALSAALVASLGNMISVRNSRTGMNLFAVNAWGMLYGTIILAAIVIFTGASFRIITTPGYLISLLYLAMFGTVLAFAAYYALLNNIGPEKASYAIVLFPVVAVILSSIFEDFVWSNNVFIGFALVLIGNAIILMPKVNLKRAIKLKV